MAQQDNQNIDVSFLEKKDANALTVKDVVMTIIRNIHWLVLCGFLGASHAWYVSDKADRIYESHAKIKIYETIQNNMMGFAKLRKRFPSNFSFLWFTI